MGHYVTAIIASSSVAQHLGEDMNLVSVPLRDGMRLVPLEDEDLDRLATFDGPRTDGFTHLSQKLLEVLSELSRNGPLVYFETEYFGGMGSQAAVAFKKGAIVPTTLQAGEGSINTALKAVGIVSNSDLDEFDHIGLSLHRNTSDWKEVAMLADEA